MSAMTAQITRYFTFFLLLCAMSAAVSSFGIKFGEKNATDEQGNRQGYWIVKGYMVNDINFGPNTTVEEGNYIDNKKEGLWKRFYPSGKLRSEITYNNNRPFGPYVIYYENERIEEKGIWHRNKNIGDFNRFYENGQAQQSFFFADNGKRNGVQKYFHDNGQLELEVNIINGKEDGIMRRYNLDGSLREETSLKDGILEAGSIKTYSTKTVKPEVVAEFEPGELEAEIDEPNEAHSFKPNGYNILYNKGQQVTQVGEFRNGRLWNGKWHRYNSNGILIRIEVYKTGKYIGTGVIQPD